MSKRSQKVSAFLWDVDGTIVNSKKFAFDTTNDALRKLGKRSYTDEEYLELFSKDWKTHVKRMGIKSAQEISLLIDTWNSRLASDKHKFKLYDGILNILTYLHRRNLKMAIVSSSSRSQLQLYFDLFRIDKFFSTVVAKEDTDDQKSMTRPVLEACERLHVSPRDCVFIDDTEDGIAAAKKLDVISIGVTWGFNSAQRITAAKPDFQANTPDELSIIITELARGNRKD